MLRTGWFSTARGDSSRSLLIKAVESIQSGQLDARIEFVFCSRDPGESEKTDIFIEQVRAYKIPLVCLSVKKFAAAYQQGIAVKDEVLPSWRLEYDRKVMSMLDGFKVDICTLAGYMLIVGQEMCSKYNMINLHPALPTGPKGTWQEVIWDLISEKAIRSGVMMHLVTPQLDRGPVITYCGYPITGPAFENLWAELKTTPVDKIKADQGENNGLFKAIRRAGFIRETTLIIHTLKAFSQGKITIDSEKKVLDSAGKVIAGYDLTSEIDAAVAAV
jgi:phosphoribosylglycinamide formyltransferase 1